MDSEPVLGLSIILVNKTRVPWDGSDQDPVNLSSLVYYINFGSKYMGVALFPIFFINVTMVVTMIMVGIVELCEWWHLGGFLLLQVGWKQ